MFLKPKELFGSVDLPANGKNKDRLILEGKMVKKIKIACILFGIFCISVVLPVCASAVQITFYQPIWEGDMIRNNHGGVLTLAHRSDTHDPTLEEALTFTRMDKTDEHPFEGRKFDCSDFTQNFQHNATQQGLHCEACVMHFHRSADGNNWDGHYINVFHTTDAGLLLIDCTTGDCIAQVEKGQVYAAVPLDQPDIMYTREVVEDFIITEYQPPAPSADRIFPWHFLNPAMVRGKLEWK